MTNAINLVALLSLPQRAFPFVIRHSSFDIRHSTFDIRH